MNETPAPLAFDARSITRPDPALLTYYIITSILTGPGFFLVIVPMLFRYHTLKYRFDDEGISMSWGVIFHQEVYVQYRRIQDIHVTRNVFHRWLGLSSVAVQTASGNAGAEMTIEGIVNPEQLRDFLYTRMRGARGDHSASTSDAHSTPTEASPESHDPAGDEALVLLREIRDELRQLRTREAR